MTDNTPTLIPATASDSPPAGEGFLPAPEKILAGNPRQWVEVTYENADATFATGYWWGAPGKWKIAYSEEEYCEIISGKVILTDANGHSQHFGAGARFTIPAGFSGTWEVVEACKKIFVVHENPT